MGILNVTPDSFSDGGEFLNSDDAIQRALQMINEGADIIDVGGESTRPGADPVSVEEELKRVVPVVEAIRTKTDALISVDTSSPEVMLATARLGINLINDVRALQRDGALEAAKQTGLPICLMHMQGDPKTMQMNPDYDELLKDVNAFFRDRIEACAQAGIGREKLILDPGFGFGKSVEHNLSLINQLETFKEHGCPLLVGLSRKSTIAKIVGEDRLIGSLVGAVWAYLRGANILRVHDVAETYQALKMARAFATEGTPN